MTQLRLLLAVCLAALWVAPSQGNVSTTYPLINYRPRYHLTCERGMLENPSIAYIQDKASLEYHIFYHCTSLIASDLPGAIPIDEWYHMSSINLVQWVPAITRGIPKGTKSISIVQPNITTTDMVAVILQEDGVYLGRSTGSALVSWLNFTKEPIITPPEGANAFEEPHIWADTQGTTFYLLVGSSVNETSVSSAGQMDSTQVPVTYLYESSDLESWVNKGVFWKGDATFGPSARSVDYYSVINAGLKFVQQVMTVTFYEQGGAYCLSGKVNFTEFNGFSVKSLRHADYGNLRSACSVLDTLGRRLVIGKVGEQRSDGWVAHDGYSGAVSLPRVVRSLPQYEVGFDVPEDVSFLYGKPLGSLTGLRLATGETELMPLLQGNQLTISATLTVSPTDTSYAAGFQLLGSSNFSEYTVVAVKNDPSTGPVVACVDVPASNGFDRKGDDYKSFPNVSKATCQQFCCGDPKCMSWVYVAKMESGQRSCPVADSCCFLKSGIPPLSRSLLDISSATRGTPNSVLSVDTRKSSLSPEAKGGEVHVPLQFTPPNLEPPSLHHRQAKTTDHQVETPVQNKHDGPVGGVRDTESYHFQMFIDRSILEVFVHGALAITERVYPTQADSLNVQLFAVNCTVSIDVEGYDMEDTIGGGYFH